jgi:hypothetical protein
MNRRRKITVALVVLILTGVLGAFFLLPSDNREQKSLEETRRVLREQGFKVDLGEFNFSTSDEFRVREAALTNAVPFGSLRNRDDYVRRLALLRNMPDLMEAAGSNSALVVWKQFKLPGPSGEDLWPALRESFDADQAGLDAACQAALAGPIRFNLNARAGTGMLLPHLAALKRLAQLLGTRVVLDLHNGNKDGAWTNLLACTRLATAWEPESTEISHLVRFACATIVFNTSWQALQESGWTDAQLLRLQREWESVDYFKSLPETAAFSRASMVAACQTERQQPLGRPVFALKDVLRSPKGAWDGFMYYRRQVRYRQHGTYEDEKDLLLHYRDRELELRRAVQAQTWSEMRSLPGITQPVFFNSKYNSGIVTMMNVRQINLASLMYAQAPGQRGGPVGRAADAESRRRIILTAIALERFRSRRGSYPDALRELAPGFLRDSTVDFMDGQPLRYRRTDDGSFVLYSVGLDCVDHGGEMPRQRPRRSPYEGSLDYGAARETDLVWPRPASGDEVERFRRDQLKALAEIADRQEDLQSEAWWGQTSRRQIGVEKLLAAKPTVRSTEPAFRGRLLSEVLRNPATTATDHLALDELLTLRPVTTGEEPDTATFEAPINYDVLTNIGNLTLYVDHPVPDDSDEGCQAGFLECTRATNGNCLLVWRTIYESPGQHALQMGLELNEPDDQPIVGPIAPFVVSNLCQFSLSSAYFNPEFGATLRAKLPEQNGTYAIEISTPANERLKTITGSTSNGIIKVHWDLTDDRGRKCTNNAFGTLIHVTLPDSGRTQTMKGP